MVCNERHSFGLAHVSLLNAARGNLPSELAITNAMLDRIIVELVAPQLSNLPCFMKHDFQDLQRARPHCTKAASCDI